MAEHDKALSYAEYWNKHYSQSDGENPTHEWFRKFEHLESFVEETIFTKPGYTPGDNPPIIHLGSGDSEIPARFHDRGYRNQLCVDFSPNVVKMMTERDRDRPGIRWAEMDVRHMTEVANCSISVAFDKGTLDAMIFGSHWSPPAMVQENTSKYLAEVHRILKDDGIFVWITYRQPHFMRPLLNPTGLWDLTETVLGDGGSLNYWGWTLRKAGSQGVEPHGTKDVQEADSAL